MGPSRHLMVQRVLPIAILALSVSSVPLMVLSPTGLGRLRALEAEKRRVDDEVSRLAAEIRQLRVQVAQIKRDPAAVEQVARDELGLVRQTELVLHFEE